MKTRVKYRTRWDDYIVQEKFLFFFWRNASSSDAKLTNFVVRYQYDTEKEAMKALIDGLVKYQKKNDKIQKKKRSFKSATISSENIKQLVPERFL